MTKRKTKFNFTKTSLNNLPIPDKMTNYRDTKSNMLIVSVYPSGNKTFFVNGSCRGQGTKTIRIGGFPSFSVQQARELADKYKVDLRNGINPADKFKELRSEVTFGEQFEYWIKNHCEINNKPKTVTGYISQYNLYLKKKLHNKKLSSITPKLIEEIKNTVYNKDGKLSKSTDRKGNRVHASNRCLTMIKTVFNYSKRLGWKGENPAEFIKKFDEKPRKRRLTKEELKPFVKSLYKAQNDDSRVFADYFLIMLATGVRRSNLQEMRWSNVNLKDATWFIPDTKNGESLTVFLSKQVVKILKEREKLNINDSEFVFSSTRAKSGHIEEPKFFLNSIISELGFKPITIHGIRHTFANVGHNIGVQEYILKMMMGHSLKSVKQALDIYITPEDNVVRESIQKVSDFIFNL